MLRREHPELTNGEAFSQEFARLSGLDPDCVWPQFVRFYEGLPYPREAWRAMRGAREAVRAARAGGRKVVVATNPLFPMRAVETRLAWAGLSDVEFDPGNLSGEHALGQAPPGVLPGDRPSPGCACRKVPGGGQRPGS